jgi:hypothetical protein
VFATLLVFLALADRLAAFTVNKLGAVLRRSRSRARPRRRVSPSTPGAAARRDPRAPLPIDVSGGNVRFFHVAGGHVFLDGRRQGSGRLVPPQRRHLQQPP